MTFKRNDFVVFVCFSLGVLLSFILSFVERENASRRFHTVLEYGAKTRISSISDELRHQDYELHTVRRFFEQSDTITQSEFAGFVEPILALPGVQSVQWIPLVRQAGRTRFEVQTGLFVRELGGGNALVPALERATYYPLKLAEPIELNADAMGFDLGSNPERLVALERARDLGEICAMEQVRLVESPDGSSVLMMVLPVYHVPSGSVEERRDNLKGFVLGMYQVGALVEGALSNVFPLGMSIVLADQDAAPGNQLLYEHRSRVESDPQPLVSDCSFCYEELLEVGGRTWKISVSPNKFFIQSNQSFVYWWILVLGVGFSFLMTLFLRNLLRGRWQAEHAAAEGVLALGVSKKRYQMLVDHQSELVVKVDLEGRFLFISPSYCRIFGKSEKALLSERFSPLLQEDDRPEAERVMAALLTPPYVAYVEHRALTIEGWRWFSWVDTAVLDDAGQVVAIMAVGRDVTERVDAEKTFRARNLEIVKTLRESEMNYRMLFQNMTVGFMLLDVEVDDDGTDPHYRLIKVNPEAERLMKRTAQELIGKTITDVFYPLESEWLGVFADVRLHGRPVAYENPVESLGMVFSTLVFVPRPGQLAVVFSDNTAHRVAEDAILQAQHLLQHVVDHINDAIFQVDLAGKCTFVNEASSRLSGYSEEELLGMSIATLAVPEYVPTLLERLSGWADGVSGASTYAFELLRKDGQRSWLELSTDGVFDSDGKICGVLGVARDISKKKELDQVIQSLSKKGNDKFRRDYFNTMAVELGNALGADLVLIGEYHTGAHPSIQTLAVGVDNELKPNFKYKLSGTPCNKLMDGESCSCLSGAGPLFPDGNDLVKGPISACVGIPLHNAKQEIVGVMVALFCQPLKTAEFVESVLQAFAGRTAAEIERRLSEDAVRMARQELQHVLDSISDIVYRIDLKGNYTYVNQCATDLLGYSYDEFMTMNLAQVAAPEYLQTLRERIKLRVQGTPIDEDIRFELVCKDGRRLWVDLDATSIYDDEGGVVGMAGMARNVTAQKKIDQLVGTLAQVGAVKFGQDFFDAMVVELGQALGADYLFIGEYHPGSPDSIETLAVGRRGALSANFSFDLPGTPCAALLEKGSCMHCSGVAARFPHASVLSEIGIECYLGVPLLDAQQKPLGIMVALFETPLENVEFSESVLQSFAGRTAAEMMRQRQGVELRRLSAAIEQSADTVVITDPTGVIQYVNPAFSVSSGYSREEAMGQTPSVLKSGHHTQSFYAEMWDTLKEGKVWHGRITNKSKEGSLYTEEATFSSVLDAAGKIINFVAVKRDISNELAMEEKYRQSQKMESIGRLAGGVAHDFNNILQSILGFSGMLMSDLEPGTPQYEDVSEIRDAARRAGELTRQLLLLSRKQGITYVELNLNDIVSNSEKMMRRLLGEKVRLVSTLQDALPPVRGDAVQLEQILLNLFVNARDAMPEGGDLTVETLMGPAACDLGDDSVCFRVTDSGCGMSEDVMSHLFEPFFTTKDVGEGTGLGLSVVYGIVEQHGGEIRVSSEINKGTTFTVCFPIQEEEQQAPVATESESAGTAAKSMEGGGEVILVIEDDLVVRSLMVRVLESAGYLVEAAETAAQARQCWKKSGETFNLLYCDVVLPDGNGVELAQEFHAIHPSLAIIFSSGYSQDCVLPDEFKRQGVRFLGKPISPLKMLQTVREMLDESLQKESNPDRSKE